MLLQYMINMYVRKYQQACAMHVSVFVCVTAPVNAMSSYRPVAQRQKECTKHFSDRETGESRHNRTEN